MLSSGLPFVPCGSKDENVKNTSLKVGSIVVGETERHLASRTAQQIFVAIKVIILRYLKVLKLMNCTTFTHLPTVYETKKNRLVSPHA
jgi:hypothetical protein